MASTLRRKYDGKVQELESTAREAHSLLGGLITEWLMRERIADPRIRSAYDCMLKLSNDINVVKSLSPQIVFVDEMVDGCSSSQGS